MAVHGNKPAIVRTGLSRVAVSRRLKKLADAGYLLRVGAGTRPSYRPGLRRFWLRHTPRDALAQAGGEQGVWAQHVAPLFSGVPDPVVNLASIAFTELLNNALDHSAAPHLLLGAHLDLRPGGRAQMLVADDGVGVFVSSRMLDRLVIESRGLRLDLHPPHQPLPPFDWVEPTGLLAGAAQGTIVRMELALDTARTAQDVYLRYFSPDEVGGDAFHTTEVPVRLAQLGSQLVSRSQGKWVVERATQFKTVVLDFEGVDLVGQGFVDEVFRVFALAHPEVRLRTANLSANVAQMLRMFAPGAGATPPLGG